jgi:hypothetical protein
MSAGGYYVPRSKTQLVEWLSRYWPKEKGKFRGKNKAVLYAIYYRVVSDIRRGKFPGPGTSK